MTKCRTIEIQEWNDLVKRFQGYYNSRVVARSMTRNVYNSRPKANRKIQLWILWKDRNLVVVF